MNPTPTSQDNTDELREYAESLGFEWNSAYGCWKKRIKTDSTPPLTMDTEEFAPFLASEAQARTEAAREAEQGAVRITEQSLELIRSLTPARPEDLTPSQWYAIADALKMAGDEIELGLKEIRQEYKQLSTPLKSDGEVK